MDKKNVLVLGMGEIGKGVYETIKGNLNSNKWSIWRKDKDPFDVGTPETFDVMHVCIPFNLKTFVSEINRLQEQFSIPLVIIHSTVLPGTTRMCRNAVHAPIRGKHPEIVKGISSYPLFVGMNMDLDFPGELFKIPRIYLEKAFDVKIEICIPLETTELAKILDLSHYAVCLEFSRLISKCANLFNVSVTDLQEFTKSRNEGLSVLEDHDRYNLPILSPLTETDAIGGHCVLPAVSLLNGVCPDMLLDYVLYRNAKAAAEMKDKKEVKPIREANKIWQPCNIYPSVKMGDGVSVGMFTEIGENVVIGDRCRIGAHCYIPEGVTIGNDCFLGPRATFTNDKYPPSGKESWEKTIVRNNVSIGAGAVILPGVTLGEKSTIGAGAVVVKNVLPCKTVCGNPATEVTGKE